MNKKTKSQSQKIDVVWNPSQLTGSPLLQKAKEEYKVSLYDKRKKLQPFEYLDRKEFERLRDAENVRVVGNVVLGKQVDPNDNDNDKIIGALKVPYTAEYADKLSEKKKGVSLNTLFFHAAVYEPKDKRCLGYVYVGDNAFLRIQRRLILIPFLLLFLLLLIIGIGTALFTPDSPVNPSNWIPKIDNGIGLEEEKTEPTQPGTIDFACFTRWTIPAGQANNLRIDLENPEGNRGYFTFEIRLADTGEVLYRSDMVPPGESLKRISLNRPLEAGDYNAVLQTYVNEVETGAQMNGNLMRFVIHAVDSNAE